VPVQQPQEQVQVRQRAQRPVQAPELELVPALQPFSFLQLQVLMRQRVPPVPSRLFSQRSAFQNRSLRAELQLRTNQRRTSSCEVSWDVSYFVFCFKFSKCEWPASVETGHA
jgi:hypothetical protein